MRRLKEISGMIIFILLLASSASKPASIRDSSPTIGFPEDGGYVVLQPCGQLLHIFMGLNSIRNAAPSDSEQTSDLAFLWMATLPLSSNHPSPHYLITLSP